MSAEHELAIFPLSNVVLFPKLQTPLHLFEPRYLQMADAVLGDDRRIGMVAVPPEHQDLMAGDPPVYPIGCAGIIAQHRRLPDGRINIVLSGEHRFRILAEEPPPRERLYRVARVEPLEDALQREEQPHVTRLRRRIADLVVTMVRRTDPERGRTVTPDLLEDLDDASFVNTLCNAFAFPTPEKQGLLEAASIPARFDRLEGLLSFRLAQLGLPNGPNAGTVH